MWIAGIWLALFGLLFVLPLFWLVPRWGAPYPSVYRRRRGQRYSATDLTDADVPVDSAHDQTSDDPWWYWADLLWFVALVMVVWLVVLVVA